MCGRFTQAYTWQENRDGIADTGGGRKADKLASLDPRQQGRWR